MVGRERVVNRKGRCSGIKGCGAESVAWIRIHAPVRNAACTRCITEAMCQVYKSIVPVVSVKSLPRFQALYTTLSDITLLVKVPYTLSQRLSYTLIGLALRLALPVPRSTVNPKVN